MKRLSDILNTIVICVLVFTLVSVVLPNRDASAAERSLAPVLESSCNSSRTVHVSGTAVVNVTPDRVLIQLGVQSNGRTPQLVEAANSATIFRVIQAIKKEEVEEKDIVTDNYVIDPIYENYDSLQIKGYRIYNMVAITLRDITKVNDIIVAALGAGANQVVNVEFYLSDLRKYRDQARDLAMVAAGEKAQDLAEAAGTEAGCVLSISENTWSYFSGGWWGHSNNLWTQNTVQNIPSGSGSGDSSEFGPVNLGQISVRAEVTASYSLE
ncbi:MAG: SIMPL domain-containing protein [Anaerolineales bacterium]